MNKKNNGEITFFSCHWLLIETLNIESWKFAGLSFSPIPEAATESSAPLCQLSQLPALNWIWHFTSILSEKTISPATQFNLCHLMHVCINGEGKRKKEVLIWCLITTSCIGMFKGSLCSAQTQGQWNYHYCISISKHNSYTFNCTLKASAHLSIHTCCL